MTVRLGVRTIVHRGSAADTGLVNEASAAPAHRMRVTEVTGEVPAIWRPLPSHETRLRSSRRCEKVNLRLCGRNPAYTVLKPRNLDGGLICARPVAPRCWCWCYWLPDRRRKPCPRNGRS